MNLLNFFKVKSRSNSRWMMKTKSLNDINVLKFKNKTRMNEYGGMRMILDRDINRTLLTRSLSLSNYLRIKSIPLNFRYCSYSTDSTTYNNNSNDSSIILPFKDHHHHHHHHHRAINSNLKIEHEENLSKKLNILQDSCSPPTPTDSKTYPNDYKKIQNSSPFISDPSSKNKNSNNEIIKMTTSSNSSFSSNSNDNSFNGSNGRNDANGNSSSTISRSEVEHFNSLGSTWWNEHGGFGLLHRMNPIRVKFIKDRIIESEFYDSRNQNQKRINNDLSSQFLTNHQTHSNLNSEADKTIKVKDKNDDQFKFLKHKKILDVGCGGGIFSEVLARLGGRVIGIDASEDSIKAARSHSDFDPQFSINHHHSNHSNNLDDPNRSSHSSLLYRWDSVESLLKDPLQNHLNTYDLVCAMEVIEHVENPFDFLSALADLTKPGGHIILSTISRTPLSKLLAITMAESSLPMIGIVPTGTHTYSKFIKPNQLIEFFRDRLGWARSYERTDLEVRGCFYDPLNANWKLMPRDAFYAHWCNYFLGAKKPLASP